MDDERRPAVVSETPSTSWATSKMNPIVPTSTGSMDDSTDPVAEVVELVLSANFFGGPSFCWRILARCPFCSRIHRHGGGEEPEPWLGYRVAPCSPRGEYRVVLTPETARTITPDAERLLRVYAA